MRKLVLTSTDLVALVQRLAAVRPIHSTAVWNDRKTKPWQETSFKYTGRCRNTFRRKHLPRGALNKGLLSHTRARRHDTYAGYEFD